MFLQVDGGGFKRGRFPDLDLPFFVLFLSIFVLFWSFLSLFGPFLSFPDFLGDYPDWSFSSCSAY